MSSGQGGDPRDNIIGGLLGITYDLLNHYKDNVLMGRL